MKTHTHTKSQIEWVAITKVRRNFHFIDFAKLRFDTLLKPTKTTNEIVQIVGGGLKPPA